MFNTSHVKVTYPWKRLTILLTILLLVSLVNVIIPVNAAPRDPRAKALQHIANQTGIPVEQLSIIQEEKARFPLQRAELVDFKILAQDGRTFGVSFEAANLQAVDPGAMAEREQQLRLARYGIIEPGLFERMKDKNPDADRIPVAIWVKTDEDQGADQQGNRDEKVVRERLTKRAANAQKPAKDALAALGANAAAADGLPILFADLTPKQIKELAKHPQVDSIEEQPQDLQPFNDDIGTSDRFTYIWPTATGSGAVVAVHEASGVDTSNTFLINPTYWCTGLNTGPGGTGCTIGQNIGSHPTNVAGVIASTHQHQRGGAWGIGSLLSANFQSFGNAQNIVNSLTWAISSGADVINMSWGGCTSGSPNFYSRVVDNLVKSFGDNLVIASGNTPNCGGSLFVASPGLAWNAITVGSYWDNDTGRRSDDVFSSFTEYQNPTDPNSTRTYEKPDITAMGGELIAPSTCFGVETTGVGASTFNSTCGTSFASPDAAALAALIVGKDPVNFRNRAELVKAVMMAGSTHNIVDGVNLRDCPASPVANDCRDGAGAINAAQTINNIVNTGNWRFPGILTPGSFDASGNIDYAVTIPAGRKIRVALAWDSTATCSSLGTASQACSGDVLNADLDLHLVDATGAVVATSSSFQNSAEVIDHQTTTAGTYTIRVRNFRFDAGTTTFAGVAWNLNTVDSFTPLSGVTTLALNSSVTGHTTNLRASYWDGYSGAGISAAPCASWRENGLERVYRVTTTSTGTIQATLSGITGFPGIGADLDVFILKASGPADALNTQGVACGDLAATASAQPAGTYYIVVDGFQGSVATYNLAVSFS